jgi:hypothetical protein
MPKKEKKFLFLKMEPQCWTNFVFNVFSSSFHQSLHQVVNDVFT